MDDEGRSYEPRQPGRLFTVGWIGMVVVIVVVTAALVLARELRVRRQVAELDRTLAQGRRVLVTRPATMPGRRTLELPATVHGYVETAIYAKIAGYLQTISVDKGDRVTEGQVLALLDSPEIDQQVANARADYRLRALTDERTQALRREGVVARQAGDEARGAMLQAKATLEQLEAMQAYKVIRAPFTGIVTSRNLDPGALVPQATTPSNAVPIVTMAALRPVRVYAEVPQSVVPHVRNGEPAVVSVTEYPGREFQGTVTRHADAVQPATRTMLVEVDVANDDDALLPGMYARVRLTVALPAGRLQVPDDALIFRGGQVFVPVVRDGRLDLAEVALGYDDGRLVEVTSGVAADDLVAINVGQAVQSGEVVQAVPAETR